MLKRITLDTNPEDCNLNCIMCEEHSHFSHFKEVLFGKTGQKYRRMPKNWITDIFTEVKKLGVTEIIPSTMGEPLIYKNIDLFFELAKQNNIQINLTTNGTFPGKSVSDWAKLIIPVTSDTKISLNGAIKQTAEKIMKGINFEKQIENIRKFVDFRNHYFNKTGFYSRITLQLTFLQNSMHELPEIVKLAAELDVDRIKGHHLWAHFKEIEALSFKNNEQAMQNWNDIVDKTIEATQKYRKQKGTKILLENISYIEKTTSIEVPENFDCPFLEKELWISATGKISPCCAPDEQRNSLGDFGNYPQTSISEVLKSDKYQNLVRNYKQNTLCKTCVMRKPAININGNFRDISEFNPILKKNIIFRSAVLYYHIGELEMIRIFDKHKIKTVVDLRALREISGNDYSSKIQEKYTIVNHPFDPWQQSKQFKENYNYGTNTEIAYRFFALECKNEIKETLEIIANSTQPVLIHCHAGKDRTGIIATILHLLSGATSDIIYADYLASAKDTKKTNLEVVLKIIENEGGIHNYLESCSLTPEQISNLKIKIRQ